MHLGAFSMHRMERTSPLSLEEKQEKSSWKWKDCLTPFCRDRTMHESFLHYLWQMQYFDRQQLKTSDGEMIEVFNPGTLNTDAGPDFSNARVKIGSIGWVGSVEVHINSSMWFEH